MARRRVFRTRLKGADDLRPTWNYSHTIGREVALERSSGSEVKITLDGAAVAQFDDVVGPQMASAIDRGQSFTAIIEKASPIYNEKFKPTGAQLDVRVEYLLHKGQSAIEAPKSWRCVKSANEPHAARLFFTKVVGVTFEGRQQIVARCSVGERLILVRDPSNPFDEGAIKVMRSNGEQLGFIPARVSRHDDSSGLAFRMDQCDKYQCRISNLTGGGERSLGVNIEITEGDEYEKQHTVETSPLMSEAPVDRIQSHRKWWLFLFAAVVLFVIVLIVRFDS